MDATWRMIGDNSHQYIIKNLPAVIGTVSFHIEKGWFWCARTIYESRKDLSSPSPQGFATSLEGAKIIVETICKETGTTDLTFNIKAGCR